MLKFWKPLKSFFLVYKEKSSFIHLRPSLKYGTLPWALLPTGSLSFTYILPLMRSLTQPSDFITPGSASLMLPSTPYSDHLIIHSILFQLLLSLLRGILFNTLTWRKNYRFLKKLKSLSMITKQILREKIFCNTIMYISDLPFH